MILIYVHTFTNSFKFWGWDSPLHCQVYNPPIKWGVGLPGHNSISVFIIIIDKCAGGHLLELFCGGSRQVSMVSMETPFGRLETHVLIEWLYEIG
jgi:hypothetical protein